MIGPATPDTGERPRSWFRRLYGAGPAHAVLMMACFAFAGYLLTLIIGASHPGWLLVWFVGAIVLHDLLFLPLYSAFDRLLTRRRRREVSARQGPTWVNHLRVPAVISGVLLLVTFPLVFRLSDHAYATASGLHESVYLERWLLVSAGLFAISAMAYLVRRDRRRRNTE